MEKKRRERKQFCALKKAYYHLSTDGWKEGLLFHSAPQYAYGMSVMGLLTLRFDICIYAFTLMPNHVHILLSGTGENCVKAFDFLRKMISARLVKDGYPPLPLQYWFKLVLVETSDQMKKNFIYIDRNAYEQQICSPNAYPWSSSYLHFSLIGKMISGTKAESLSLRKLESLTACTLRIPPHWEFHPQYGLLPASFVDNSLFHKLFRHVKDYETHLVKDYESYVKLARSLDETTQFSLEECRDITDRLMQGLYAGRRLKDLQQEEKARLAVILMKEYDLPVSMIALSLKIPEHLVQQILRAKDFGRKLKEGTWPGAKKP